MRKLKPMLLLTTALLAGCEHPPPKPDAAQATAPAPPDRGKAMSMTLTSPAFAPNAAIPAKHGRRSGNVSPPLAWTDPPAGTKAFALLVDDPDAPAGDWVHWVILNLPADARALPEGVGKDARLPDGSLNGKNDFGELGWDGPSPPSGTHRYVFKLYALDGPLALGSGASKSDLLRAAEGHTLGTAELVGTYTQSPAAP